MVRQDEPESIGCDLTNRYSPLTKGLHSRVYFWKSMVIKSRQTHRALSLISSPHGSSPRRNSRCDSASQDTCSLRRDPEPHGDDSDQQSGGNPNTHHKNAFFCTTGTSLTSGAMPRKSNTRPNSVRLKLNEARPRPMPFNMITPSHPSATHPKIPETNMNVRVRQWCAPIHPGCNSSSRLHPCEVGDTCLPAEIFITKLTLGSRRCV